MTEGHHFLLLFIQFHKHAAFYPYNNLSFFVSCLYFSIQFFQKICLLFKFYFQIPILIRIILQFLLIGKHDSVRTTGVLLLHTFFRFNCKGYGDDINGPPPDYSEYRFLKAIKLYFCLKSNVRVSLLICM